MIQLGNIENKRGSTTTWNMSPICVIKKEQVLFYPEMYYAFSHLILRLIKVYSQ